MAFSQKRKNVSIFLLPSNRGCVFYGFRITQLSKFVKNRCGKIRHSRIGSNVQTNKLFSWNRYWKSKREWIRIKNNQNLNSEILLLSLETGSNTGYNCNRTLFSAGYSRINRTLVLPSQHFSHWSMFTSDCRWQRRLSVRYYIGFLEPNGCFHEKLMEMVCIFIFVDVNTKQENMPPSTWSIKIILF